MSVLSKESVGGVEHQQVAAGTWDLLDSALGQDEEEPVHPIPELEAHEDPEGGAGREHEDDPYQLHFAELIPLRRDVEHSELL